MDRRLTAVLLVTLLSSQFLLLAKHCNEARRFGRK